jgi:hypothetical protein
MNTNKGEKGKKYLLADLVQSDLVVWDSPPARALAKRFEILQAVNFEFQTWYSTRTYCLLFLASWKWLCGLQSLLFLLAWLLSWYWPSPSKNCAPSFGPWTCPLRLKNVYNIGARLLVDKSTLSFLRNLIMPLTQARKEMLKHGALKLQIWWFEISKQNSSVLSPDNTLQTNTAEPGLT